MNDSGGVEVVEPSRSTVLQVFSAERVTSMVEFCADLFDFPYFLNGLPVKI